MMGRNALLALVLVSPCAGQHRVTIAPGVDMPLVSEGAAFLQEDLNETKALELWFASGGRGVDTAWNYNNQRVVGWAINNASATVRRELFITTKIPCVASAGAALQYIKNDLELLAVSSVDLVLIHSPGYGTPPVGQKAGCWGHLPCCHNASELRSTWHGLEEALRLNLTRAIGVSNFRAEHLEALAGNVSTMPAINQCQMYVGEHDDEAIKVGKRFGVTYEAYSPLGPWNGAKPVLTDPTVAAIAKAHNVSSAEVGMAWIVQQGIPMVTASTKADHDLEDIHSIFDVALTDTEMTILSAVRVPNSTDQKLGDVSLLAQPGGVYLV